MRGPGNRIHYKKTFTNLLIEFGVWIIVIIYLIPVYMLVQIALKTPREFVADPYGIPANINFNNIIEAWIKMNMPGPIFNTIIIVGFSVLGVILLSALASYGISRSRKKWAKFFYIFFLFGIMLNFQMIMIPLYKLVFDLKLVGTYFGAICVYVALNMGFSVLVYTGFIGSIPATLDEAAKIDGAGKTRIFFSVIFPLLRPATISIIVFNSVWIWNDLLLPLLFLGKYPTITTALYNFQGQKYTIDWTMVFAGSLISILPLVIAFLFLQKYFIKGMTAAAIKG